MSKEKLFTHPGMQVLQKALRREMWQQKLAAGILLFFGLSMLYVFFQNNYILSIIGLTASVLGVKYVYQTNLVAKVEDTTLMQLLQNQPRHIVWVYTLVTERLPFGFQIGSSGTIYFKLINGDEISVALSAKKLKLVSRTLNRILPHASFGYSEEKNQRFNTDPAMLLKDRA